MSGTGQKSKAGRRNKTAEHAKRLQIGARLRKLREDRGLYQKEVAGKLEPPVWPQAVAKWESGAVSLPIYRLAELAKIYGVEVSELIG